MHAPHAYDPGREELVHIAGDAPDPMGTGLVGQEATTDLRKNAMATVLIRWRDKVIEAELYETDGQLMLHLVCPKCSTPDAPHGLHVKQSAKRIEYDRERNLLYVEPFGCTWETGADRKAFGLNLCNWRVAIDGNIAKDA